mgnify:CR=1 FL=1|tara:strand:- start:205 stop:363 length:159 start_codon:yes stop_codon:yes gene_type:complete
MKNKQPLTTSIRKLATKIAQAYKSEIIIPAEEAITEWLKEISEDREEEAGSN